MHVSIFSPRGPRERTSGILKILGLAVAGTLLVFALIYLCRAPIATFLLREYLAGRGVRSHIVVDSIDFRGIVAHGSLGRKREAAFAQIVVTFDPHRWLPEVAEVHIHRPVVHVAIGSKGISLGSLQPLLASQPVQPASTMTLFSLVSPRLAITVSQAQLFAATPAGPVEIGGNAEFVAGRPQRIDAVVRPAHLRTRMLSAHLTGGTLHSIATSSGLRTTFSLSGSAAVGRAGDPIHVERVQLLLNIPTLYWHGAGVSASSATLTLRAEVYRHGVPPTPWQLGARFPNLSAGIVQGRFQSAGGVAVTANGSLSRADARALIAATPLLGGAPRTAKTLLGAARDLTLTTRVSWQTADQTVAMALDAPVQLNGAGSITLRLTPGPAGLRLTSADASGGIEVAMRGRNVPNAVFAIPKFSWHRASHAFGGAFGITARFDYGTVRGIAVDALGAARLQNGVFRFVLARCAALRIASLTSRGTPLRLNAGAALCAKNDQPLFIATPTGWSFSARIKNARALAGSSGLQLSGDGVATFDGSSAGPGRGAIDVAATVSDRAKKPRLAPMSITGRIRLAGAEARGRFTVAARRRQIGAVTFVQHGKTGAGHAALDFTDIVFASQGLQPADLSPLLAPIAQASGEARFTGHIGWTAKHISSDGRLDISDLRFSSPLGTAEQLRTHLDFTSLLPPTTAPGQQIAISRVDWMVPLTKIETVASFGASKLRIDSASTGLAGGTISLSPLVIDLKTGKTISGTLHLSHVGLGSLLAASNLGGQVHLAGQMSGAIPFSFGPSGLHFANGRIEADGPGRLAIDPSLWGAGQPSAAEKFAYRAVQNLAYDLLSATVASEPSGRLRLVFHIKGYSDSPGQDEEVNLFDLLRGTAFQKSIPLPRGTPIDLTLDISLNFDELLRGYRAAWSVTETR